MYRSSGPTKQAGISSMRPSGQCGPDLALELQAFPVNADHSLSARILVVDDVHLQLRIREVFQLWVAPVAVGLKRDLAFFARLQSALEVFDVILLDPGNRPVRRRQDEAEIDPRDRGCAAPLKTENSIAGCSLRPF